jgi:hypothetical protein
MNVAADSLGSADARISTAAPGPDALAARLLRLRLARREPGWAAGLLDLARNLTLAEAGAVLAREADGTWRVLAPETEAAPPPSWAALAEAAVSGGLLAAAPGEGGRFCFAALLGPADPPSAGAAARRGVLALEVLAHEPAMIALTRERIAFLAALAEAGAVEAVSAIQAPQALAAAVAETLRQAPDPAAGLHRAAMLLASAVPGVQRVAILLRPGRRGARLGLSDQPRVEPGAELPRLLIALAEEAIARAAPHAGEATSPAERGFAAAFGARPLLSVPARGRDEAAVILAFAPGAVVPEGLAARLQPAADMLGALAALPPPRGPRRRGLVAAGAAAALIGALAILPRPAEVPAPFVLQPERARSITAPFDGILEASAAQPGDAVQAGVTPLARLNTREVELELAAARARAANDRREAAMARAAGEPAKEQIGLLAARRAEAQVGLLEYRLGLADIRAPVDGTIVAGDLRRSLGQPLSRGQVLFEIALPGPLRAEVLVLDEHIPMVAPGQRVRLSPAAEPGHVRIGRVQRVRPMAEVVQGRNVFRVITTLEGAEQEGLRPGMEGWARIETAPSSWLAWLLRDPVRWVRRQVWV